MRVVFGREGDEEVTGLIRLGAARFSAGLRGVVGAVLARERAGKWTRSGVPRSSRVTAGLGARVSERRAGLSGVKVP